MPPSAPKKENSKRLISLSDKENLCKQAIEVGKGLAGMGFTLLATEGNKVLPKEGIDCTIISKLNEGRPNVLDVILNRECVCYNTPSAKVTL